MAPPPIDGARLRGLREQRGWSQQRLARESGVDQSVISRIERGRAINPRMDSVRALAATLGVPVEAFASALSTGPTSVDVHDPELAVMLADVGDELTDDELTGVKEYLAFVLARKRAREQASART